jgi:2-keto-3-deoxy-L-rhamnonate aldolase RhmA
MAENRLKERWKAGKAAVNGWLAIPSGFSAEVMAQCGWDSVTVDMQHGVQDYQTMVQCFQAMDRLPVTKLVRIYLRREADDSIDALLSPRITSKQDMTESGP